VSDGLDLECAAVRDEVDAECAGVLLAGARDQDVDVGGECGLGVVLNGSVSISVVAPIYTNLILPHGP
jgi:hypothetical protein